MKNRILLLIFLFTSSFIYAIEIQKIEINEIPKSIKFKGNFGSGYKWKDNNGINYLILSETSPFIEKNNKYVIGENEYGKTIYAQQFIVSNGKTELLWDIKDFERNCPFDLDVSFLNDSIKVTDLDKNGITETLIAYKLSCKSDVSPARIKILMHENQQKFGLRGYTRHIYPNQPYNENEFFEYNESKLSEAQRNELDYRVSEGRYMNELDFENSPKIFLEFAIENWKEISTVRF